MCAKQHRTAAVRYRGILQSFFLAAVCDSGAQVCVCVCVCVCMCVCV